MACNTEALVVGIHSLNSLVLSTQQGLMRDLEEKEKELNKLKLKADGLLNSNHPASDKIQVKYFAFVVILSNNRSSSLALLILCALPGLHGHLTDTVELAPPDHQVHPCSSEGKCCLQPSKCFFLHLLLCKKNLVNTLVSACPSFLRRLMTPTRSCRRSMSPFEASSPATRAPRWKTSPTF